MNKQQAIEIIERAPVGWELYSTARDRFYCNILCQWFAFDLGEWKVWPAPLYSTKISFVTNTKILEIALGED
tara:strand:- start:37481 stop:37696 length:216 start_codon:yes stop_codon:yes gene_type:complete